MSYVINQESVDFLFQHNMLPKNEYTNLVELQYDLDEAYNFVLLNAKEKTYYDYFKNELQDGLIYDSFYFAIVEYHIFNSIN